MRCWLAHLDDSHNSGAEPHEFFSRAPTVRTQIGRHAKLYNVSSFAFEDLTKSNASIATTVHIVLDAAVADLLAENHINPATTRVVLAIRHAGLADGNMLFVNLSKRESAGTAVLGLFEKISQSNAHVKLGELEFDLIVDQ